MTTLHARDRSTLDVEDGLRAVETVIRGECASEEPLLQRMAEAVVAAGGKRLRPRVALLAYAALADSDETLVPPDAWPVEVSQAAAAFELIHTATLVHDDIIDQSPLRRGKPTLHLAYGVPHAIVAADFLFTRGFGLSGRLPKEVIRITTDACTRLAEGEVLEQRLLTEDLDVEQYLKIIAKKTAEPLRACAETGAYLAVMRADGSLDAAGRDVVRRYGEYGLDMGLAFQIQDDLLDIVGDAAETGKPVGLDKQNGVRSLPDLIAGVAEKRGESDVLAAARGVAERYVARAKDAIAPVTPAGPHREALFALADAVVKRRA